MIEQNIMEELRKFYANSRRGNEHPHGHHDPQEKHCPMGPEFRPGPMGPQAFGRPAGPCPMPFGPMKPSEMQGRPGCPGRKPPFQHGTFRILDNLSETEGVSQIQLAEKLQIRPQSVSEAVRNLAAKGFVRKELCGEDRRSVRVFLTEEGAIFRAEMQEMREYRASKCFAALTEEEKEELLRLLKKLNEGEEKAV